MAYKQLRAFNESLAGSKAGWCLQNVRKGFSIPAKYSNAITAWGHTAQHKDRNIPSDLDVLLFYGYGKDGHVNVRLANGQVWSDGNLYASLQDYLDKHPSVYYLGWGESVNDVPVLQYYVLPQIFRYTNYVPANAAGRRVYLGARCKTWRVYKPGTRTHVGTLLPAANGGLSYIVRGIDTLPNRVLIQSGTFGKVSLPVDSDATFK